MRNKLLLLGAALALLAFAPSARAEGFFANRGYVSFSGGGVLQQSITLRNSLGETAQATFDPGFRLDVSAGLETPNGLAFELETSLIYNSFDKIDGVPLDATGDNLQMLEVPLLFNVLYKPKLSSSVSGYVGVGVGGVATTFYSEHGFFTEYETDLTFGYQAMAGFNYQLDERWGIGLAYKFLGTTDHDLGFGVKSGGTFTHSFLISVNCVF
jgi:opacity protein-like surface antigen